MIRIENGTHVSAWADPNRETTQGCIADFLASL
jgi:hypothetical protein